jgi:hypothetical protein
MNSDLSDPSFFMNPIATPQALLAAQAFLDACAPALLLTRPAPANLAIASSYLLAAAETTFGPSPLKQWWLSVTSAPSWVLFAPVVLGTYPSVLACSSYGWSREIGRASAHPTHLSHRS